MVNAWIIDQLIKKEKTKDDRPRLELPVINQTDEDKEPKEQPQKKKNSIIHIEIYDDEEDET